MSTFYELYFANKGKLGIQLSSSFCIQVIPDWRIKGNHSQIA